MERLFLCLFESAIGANTIIAYASICADNKDSR